MTRIFKIAMFPRIYSQKTKLRGYMVNGNAAGVVILFLCFHLMISVMGGGRQVGCDDLDGRKGLFFVNAKHSNRDLSHTEILPFDQLCKACKA